MNSLQIVFTLHTSSDSDEMSQTNKHGCSSVTLELKFINAVFASLLKMRLIVIGKEDIQQNFNGSNTLGTMKRCSRQG